MLVPGATGQGFLGRNAASYNRKVTINDVTLPDASTPNKAPPSAIQILSRALKMKILMTSVSGDSLAGSFMHQQEASEQNEEEHLTALEFMTRTIQKLEQKMDGIEALVRDVKSVLEEQESQIKLKVDLFQSHIQEFYDPPVKVESPAVENS